MFFFFFLFFPPNQKAVSMDEVIRTVAEHSHGFVGADLQLLCSEAILSAVKRFHEEKVDHQNTSNSTSTSTSTSGGGSRTMCLMSRDFMIGLGKVKPSALREVAALSHSKSRLLLLFDSF
jgi:SpoVK/Ycf46/Vps4 family AAA+-type ATPase